VTEYPS